MEDWEVNPWLPVSVMSRVEDVTTRLGLSGDYPSTDQSYPFALLQTVTASRGVDVLVENIGYFQDLSLPGDIDINPFNPNNMRWKVFLRKLVWSHGEWDIFQSDRGHLGLGPATMQSGDILCVFSGGKVPFILHPLNEKDYRLVGECYIHGTMDGEATEHVHGGQLDAFTLY